MQRTHPQTPRSMTLLSLASAVSADAGHRFSCYFLETPFSRMRAVAQLMGGWRGFEHPPEQNWGAMQFFHIRTFSMAEG
jgi:hypothetical protein